MRSTNVGSFGVTDAEWKNMLVRLRSAKSSVITMSRKGKQGFLDLPSDRELREQAERLATHVQSSFTDMVVLGIGGSDLGARTLYRALGGADKKKAVRLHFSGSSTDPDDLAAILANLNLKKTCVNVVSKSGGTLETMSAFLVFRDLLKKRVGERKFAKHIIATTDPESGALHGLAHKEGYHILPVPQNVGGRFSVLSPVGIFPAAAAGIDTEALLAGAKAQVKRFLNAKPASDDCARYAGMHVVGMEQRKQSIHVLMPYVKRLDEFARWVRQLVAESLGKKESRKGKVIHVGPTPVAALGPEDQHSQLQLYAEGPFDKLITFIGLRRFHTDIKTPDARGVWPEMERFGNKSFTKLIDIERTATAEALRQLKRPNGTIELNRLDEQSMGDLLMFFEIAVALMGELLDVNAYDQPGVELSKKLMKEALTANR